MDDDEWVERLRRAVADGAATVPANPSGPSVDPASEPAPQPRDVGVDALASTLQELQQAIRNLDEKVATVNSRLRLLEARRDQVVGQIADAVVARLDARPAPAAERGWRSSAGRWISG